MKFLKLNKFSREDINNLLSPNLQQYLHQKFHIEDEVMIENQLFCDEAPLSGSDPTFSQESIKARQAQSQPIDDAMLSQTSFLDQRNDIQNSNSAFNNHVYSQGSQRDYGANNNLLSHPNSIHNTPLKKNEHQKNLGGNGVFGSNLGFGSLRNG